MEYAMVLMSLSVLNGAEPSTLLGAFGLPWRRAGLTREQSRSRSGMDLDQADSVSGSIIAIGNHLAVESDDGNG